MSKNYLESVSLSIVCVVANEKKTIRKFILEVLSLCNSFKKVNIYIVFDSLDNDGSKQIVYKMSQADKRIKYIYHASSKNVVDSILHGYKCALNSKPDYILDMNSGYRHLPSDLFKFFSRIPEGFDCIFGSRFIKGGSLNAPSFLRSFYSRGGSIISNLLFGTKLTDMTSGYQLYHRHVIDFLLKKEFISQYHFINTEIKYYCKNFLTLEVPINYSTPAASVRSYVIFDSLKCLFLLFLKRFF